MLTSPDLLSIQELLLTEFGGMRGVTQAGFGRLEAAAAAPYTSAFGERLFGTPQAQAAALCYAIVKGHPFSDGNKRVALVALDLALNSAGYTLTASNDEAYTLIMGLADGSLNRDALLAWLELHAAVRR